MLRFWNTYFGALIIAKRKMCEIFHDILFNGAKNERVLRKRVLRIMYTTVVREAAYYNVV